MGPNRDYGDVIRGWSQLRVRKAVVGSRGLLLELGSEGKRAGVGRLWGEFLPKSWRPPHIRTVLV